MDENKKDKWEFLKIKLDFVKPFLTTLIILDAGLISYGFVNFEKNSTLFSSIIFLAIIGVAIAFICLLLYCIKILKEMKGML